MTEKEKMMGGQQYDSRDPELLRMSLRARRLFNAYNQLDPGNPIERERILSELLGAVGSGVWIEPPFYCDYGEFISIGENTFVNANCMFLDDNYITIGKNGLLAPCVQIYTASHPLKVSERLVHTSEGTRYRTFTRPVTLGDNVWIGGNSVILPGVTIGDDVTIGAGSVVTRDVPNGVLAFGNPCKVIREL